MRLWLLISFSVLYSTCYSQDTAIIKKDSARTAALAGVTVYGRVLTLPHVSATPAQVLKGAALDKLNSLSVADAMRFFSGVQLKDYGGIGGIKTLNVRSLGTNHLGVFYDGIELGNAQNGIVDLGKFSLDNLEEIALYNGQKSEIFQPAKSLASGAALYLQSRKPVFLHGEQTHLKAAFKTGSFGLLNPSLLWEQKISSRVTASVSTELTEANGRYRFRYTNGVYDTTAIRENADVHAWRIETVFHGLLQDSSEWQAQGYYYQSGRGLPGAVVANQFKHPQRQWDNDLFVQASFKSAPGKRYRLWLNTKYAHDYTRYLDPEYNNIQGYLDNRYTQQEWYLSAAHHYSITHYWDVALATDLLYNTLDANLYHFVYPTRYTTLASLATELHDNRFNIQASILGSFVTEQVKAYTGAGNQHEWTPAIALSWQPFATPAFGVRAFYKSIFRMPTFNDLYYTFIGNTSLQPEFTKQYDLGVSYTKSFSSLLQSVSVQADGYYNTVTNKIVAIPTASLFRWMMLNLGAVQIKGADLNLRSSWKTGALLTELGIKYTYQQALDVTPGAYNYKQQIPYTPLNSGSAIVNEEWKSWSLQYSFIYTGSRYSEEANIPVNYVQPWYTHDLSLMKNYRYKKQDIRVTIAVNNLFNQYYDVVLNFPMPGRNYRVGVQVNL